MRKSKMLKKKEEEEISKEGEIMALANPDDEVDAEEPETKNEEE